MSIEESLLQRANNKCELCGCENDLDTFLVSPKDEKIVVCQTCKEQLEDHSKIDETHWHCLNESMWSEVDAVKVVAYRMLTLLNNQELLDMMYLEDDILEWAKDGLDEEDDSLIYKDANGNILNAGDTVVILKDLPVKGAGFTAKQGTAVRNISLVPNDETHIEGRVNGVKIHLKTCFLKKS